MIKKIKILQYSGDTGGYPIWSPGLARASPTPSTAIPT
jgi:hypothetical protein